MPPEIEQLSTREIEVMVLYSNPYLGKEYIARELNITVSTLNTHIINIFQKLGESDRFAAAFAFFAYYPQHRDLIDKVIRERCE